MVADVANLDQARALLDKEAEARRAQQDWRAELAPSGSGFLGDERNMLIALRKAPELAGLVRFNEFALNVEFAKPPPWRAVGERTVWCEDDDTALADWLQRAGLKVRGSTAIGNCVALAARDQAFHPVRDYLNALKWDGEPRAQIWLADYLEATGNVPYLAAVGTRFLVSAVARILQPGCQADHVLVLEAPQGAGKTSAARALAIRPEWFAGDLPEIHGKDARLQLLGRWIIEIAELKAMRTSDLEAQKSFLTQTHDTFRPPYGRRTAQFPRQCVFVATTNEREYLRDRTGNRRYWPVRCGQIDVAALVRDREQLWAEAVHEFRRGTAWHLTQDEAALAEEQQHERVHLSETEQDVNAYLASVKGTIRDGKERDSVTVKEVLVHALRLDPDKPSYAESARKFGPVVAEALERAGLRKDRRTRMDGEKRTVYRWGGQGGQA